MSLHNQSLLLQNSTSYSLQKNSKRQTMINNLLASTIWTSSIGAILSIFSCFVCFIVIIADRIANPDTGFNDDRTLLISCLFFLLFFFFSIVGVVLGSIALCVWFTQVRNSSLSFFLRQVKKQDYLYDKIEQLKQTDPIFMWHIRVLDSNQTEILYKSAPFQYEYAVDTSQDFQVDSPFRPFTQLAVKLDMDMDSATKEAFQEMERDLIRKYGVSANSNYETWYTVHLPGLSPTEQASTKLHLPSSKKLLIGTTDEDDQDSSIKEILLLKVSREQSSSGKNSWRFVNRASYYLLSLVCMGEKYKEYLESLCGYQTLLIKKKIYGVPRPQFSLY